MSEFGGAPYANPDNVEGIRCNTCRVIFSTVDRIREHYRGDFHILNSRRRSQELQPVTKEEFKAQYNKQMRNQQQALAKAAEIKKQKQNPITLTSTPEQIVKAEQRRKKELKKREQHKILEQKRIEALTGRVPNRPMKSTLTDTDITSKRDTLEDDMPALEDYDEDTNEYRTIAINGREVKETYQNNSNDKNEVVIDEASLSKLTQGMNISTERAKSILKLAVQEEQEDPLAKVELQYLQANSNEDDDDDDEDWEDVDEESDGDDEEDNTVYLPVAPHISIFDNKEFSTTATCVAYMEREFGFFIPDRDYLVDLDGFLQYLGEKVKIGGICLYCQKHMKPGHPCQSHMRSKSHQKIRFQEHIDLDEFEDFYDYSTSYEDGELNDDGELIDDSNESVMEVIPETGELRLQDGKILGHRAFRRYYNQYVPPEDTRPAVVAARRENLLKAANARGGVLAGLDVHRIGLGSVSEDGMLDAGQIARLTDSQVAALLVRERKKERKALVVMERAKRKYEFREQRREFASVRDKIRSKENTTMKIRDYHSMIQ